MLHRFGSGSSLWPKANCRKGEARVGDSSDCASDSRLRVLAVSPWGDPVSGFEALPRAGIVTLPPSRRDVEQSADIGTDRPDPSLRLLSSFKGQPGQPGQPGSAGEPGTRGAQVSTPGRLHAFCYFPRCSRVFFLN